MTIVNHPGSRVDPPKLWLHYFETALIVMHIHNRNHRTPQHSDTQISISSTSCHRSSLDVLRIAAKHDKLPWPQEVHVPSHMWTSPQEFMEDSLITWSSYSRKSACILPSGRGLITIGRENTGIYFSSLAQNKCHTTIRKSQPSKFQSNPRSHRRIW